MLTCCAFNKTKKRNFTTVCEHKRKVLQGKMMDSLHIYGTKSDFFQSYFNPNFRPICFN